MNYYKCQVQFLTCKMLLLNAEHLFVLLNLLARNSSISHDHLSKELVYYPSFTDIGSEPQQGHEAIPSKWVKETLRVLEEPSMLTHQQLGSFKSESHLFL